MTGEQAYNVRKSIVNDTSNVTTEMKWTRTRAGEGSNNMGTAKKPGAPMPPRAIMYPGMPKKGLRIDELLKQAVKGIDLIKNAPYKEISVSTWTLFQHSLGSYQTFAEEACRQIAMATKVETARKPALSMEPVWGKPRSWDGPLANGNLGPARANESKKKIKSAWTDTRKAKSLTIRLVDDMAREDARKQTGEQVLQAFKKMKTPYTDQLVAVKITKEGNILLHAATVEVKEKLERNNGWLREADPTAVVLRQISPVMVHRYAIGAVDVKRQKEIKEKIEGQNKRLHSGLEVIKVEWPNFAEKLRADGKKKTHSTLLVQVASPEMADRMIMEEVIEGANLLSCEKWDRAAELVQCFKCHGYGHITSRCSQTTCCGTCASNHSFRDHEQLAAGSEQIIKKCVVCNKEKHAAWEPVCEVRIREKKRKQ